MLHGTPKDPLLRSRVIGYNNLMNPENQSQSPTQTNDLHWAAGFFEGRGSFGMMDPKDGNEMIPWIQVDRQPVDLITKFAETVVVGITRAPYPKANRLYVSNYRANGKRACQAFVDLMWPYLTPYTQNEMRRKGFVPSSGAGNVKPIADEDFEAALRSLVVPKEPAPEQ